MVYGIHVTEGIRYTDVTTKVKTPLENIVWLSKHMTAFGWSSVIRGLIADSLVFCHCTVRHFKLT